MFRLFELLAKLLFPLRFILLFGAIVSAGALVFLPIFTSITTQNDWLIIVLLTFLWCLVLRGLVYCFQPLPHPTEQRGMMAAIKQKLNHVIQLIFSLLFIAVFGVTLYLSIKLLTL